MTNEEIMIAVADKVKGEGVFYEDGHIYIDIFSRKFAKAFWGKEPLNLNYVSKYMDLPTDNDQLRGMVLVLPDVVWQYHLQQIVFKKHPLKYLKRFLK